MNFRLDLNRKKLNYPALGFLIPFLGMLMVMLISQYEPFGKTSMLYSDMYHQYYPFFLTFRNTLRRGESLLYTWNMGMGMDYLGLISYYLASPLNLLSVLVPDSWTLEYFSLLMPLKLGLAGLFFSLFLKHIFGREDFSISVFGGLYGLCAWALGYQWNIMWLDTFALLPLVALGTVQLVREKKFILYTVTLFLSVYSNYYIGLFTCIFVFFLFFCIEICRFSGFKRFFLDLVRIAWFSFLAIGMTMILELPALAALQTTQSSVNKFPTGFRLNMTRDHSIRGLFEAMRKVTGNMGIGIEPSFKEGLPNLYCGVVSIFLAFLYLMAREVKLREKVCGITLLVFFQLSFIIRQLDYIWHGFHFTNMIPYRFSFLYSFVLLTMAYKAWTVRRKFGIFPVLGAAVGTTAVLSCSQLLREEPFRLLGDKGLSEAGVFLLENGLLVITYTGLFLAGRIYRRLPETAEPEQIRLQEKTLSRRRMYLRAGALGVCMVEILLNLLNFGMSFNGTGVDNYPRGREDAASMIRYVKEREKYDPFFRMETTHSQTLNDGALNDYYGISAFTSSANVHVTEFMKALGYGAKNTYNRYCFEESSPVANLFLDLKYMLDRQGRDRSSTWFTEVHHFGKVHLLQNNAYLPLGFLTRPELQYLEFPQEGDRFLFQNDLLKTASGIENPVWEILNPEKFDVTTVNVTVDSIASGKVSYQDAEKNAELTYTIRPEQTGFLCIHLDFPKRNHYSVRINDQEQYRENISLPQMIAVGDVKPGDKVEVIVTIKENEKSSVTLEAAVLNAQRFREAYELLARTPMKLSSFEKTRLEGTVDCRQAGLLYTSIPQNGNWHVYVDGREAEPALVGDAMLAVPLEAGMHHLIFRYRNPAFTLGAGISLACGFVFLLNVLAERKKQGKNASKKKTNRR